MAASSPCGSGVSSGSTVQLTNSGSEGDPRHLIVDQRKRKRMLSNRESARRSRMRKQKRLDDLTAEAALLRQENGRILASLKAVAQQAAAVEAENSVLRAQVAELSFRLQSLEEILQYVNGSYGGDGGFACSEVAAHATGVFSANPWGLCSANNLQAILASPDLFQY